MAPCSVDYLAGLIPQTNPPLLSEFLCSCAPPCSSQTRFCRALKQKWARDEAKHSKFSASLLWLLPLSARGERELPGFRVLKATRNSLCCAKPNNPTEGTQTAKYSTAGCSAREVWEHSKWEVKHSRLPKSQTWTLEMQTPASLKSGPHPSRKVGNADRNHSGCSTLLSTCRKAHESDF